MYIVQYSICSIVIFPPQYYPHLDARKLWIKRALRQPNRHASTSRHASTAMRQSMNWSLALQIQYVQM